MNKNEIHRALEEDFKATFIEELIPGILHNFANPLNGIMGRTKLLQRRIEENFRKVEAMYPEAAAEMMNEMQRIKMDVSSVNQEAEYFFDMFKDIAGKFYSLTTKEEDQINLSHLLAAEMRFANFYLDFKHEIKKNMQWDNETPYFKGNTADLSLAFWRLIRFAMSRALASRLREFQIKTDHDHEYINVSIKSSGNTLMAFDTAALIENLHTSSSKADGIIDRGALLSLSLFDQYRAKINIFTEDALGIISIGFPYRTE